MSNQLEREQRATLSSRFHLIQATERFRSFNSLCFVGIGLSLVLATLFLPLLHTQATGTKHTNQLRQTTSLYERTVDSSTLQRQGCQAAKGTAGLVILDFGEPEYNQGSFGIGLFSNIFVSDDAILHAAANFIYGAWQCRTGHTNIKLGVGLSNYNSPSRGLGDDPSAWYEAGRSWGSMIDNLESFVQNQGFDQQFTAYGAQDIEVDEVHHWANYMNSASFVQGYDEVTQQLFVDFGDDPGGLNPAPWSIDQLWNVIASGSQNVILPEIYYDVDATLDWAVFSRWSCSSRGAPLRIIGVMAEYPTGNSPAHAWSAMYNALTGDSCTASGLNQMLYTTNIQ